MTPKTVCLSPYRPYWHPRGSFADFGNRRLEHEAICEARRNQGPRPKLRACHFVRRQHQEPLPRLLLGDLIQRGNETQRPQHADCAYAPRDGVGGVVLRHLPDQIRGLRRCLGGLCPHVHACGDATKRASRRDSEIRGMISCYDFMIALCPLALLPFCSAARRQRAVPIPLELVP